MTSETNDTVAIHLPKNLVSELANYTDCYAPLLKQVAQACTEALKESELDIVEELRFFAEASDTDGLVLTMLSGRTFTDAANEIERLRSQAST